MMDKIMIFKYVCVIFSLIPCYFCQEKQNDVFKLIQIMENYNSEKGSWVFSPASLRSVLEELYIASGGDTKSQLASCLSIGTNEDIVEEQSRLNEAPGDGVIWKMANKILVKNSFPLSDKFKSEVASLFRSQVENNDFSNPQLTATSINTWVSNNTGGQIKKLVTPGDVGPSNNLIILNAAYFKATWKFSFKEKETEQRCFYTEPKSCVQIPFMKQRNQFKYGIHKELGAELLQIPYNDKRYTLVVALPNEYDGLQDLVSKLPNANLMDFINKMEYEHTDLLLPKFTSKYKSNFNEALKQLGIKSIFEPSANFSAMTDTGGVFASNVFHEAHISVSEKGTIAAAATGMIMTRTLDNVPPKYVSFNVDHPFLYFIVFNNTNVLFAGKYTT